MNERSVNVLFLCTGNSARSILGEMITARLGQGRFRSFSAGSNPTGQVNPFAIETLRRNDYPFADVRSKSWSEFAGADAPAMDIVVTVCDNAAAEACPVWPGHPLTIHWGLPDPAAVEGSDHDRLQAFQQTFDALKTRIERLVSLPIGDLSPALLKERLSEIGR